jgi:hypothetical protein
LATLIAGLVAIFAALLAYRGSLKEVKATRDQIEAARDLEQKKADDRKQAFVAMAALECQHLEKDAEELKLNVIQDGNENLNTSHVLRRIAIREFLRTADGLRDSAVRHVRHHPGPILSEQAPIDMSHFFLKIVFGERQQ